MISGTSRQRRFAKVVMFIRLSKMLMGKHALAGKADQVGESVGALRDLRRQAITPADKTPCSTGDPVNSCL
jgi:hypothetical protein